MDRDAINSPAPRNVLRSIISEEAPYAIIRVVRARCMISDPSFMLTVVREFYAFVEHCQNARGCAGLVPVGSTASGSPEAEAEQWLSRRLLQWHMIT
jgi:hypothetical protein